MGKRLSEMSLEELWHLFPIFLTEHQACWKEWYAEEECALAKLIPEAKRISHIGSTAIDPIWAKPIIDILVEMPVEGDLSATKDTLSRNGYICMNQGADRASFNKGYTENGFAEKVFHVHIRRIGDHDELYFRDYLIDHPDVALRYEEMKLDLWKRYEHDRDGYTAQKTEFVQVYTTIAKATYKNRYECDLIKNT